MNTFALRIQIYRFLKKLHEQWPLLALNPNYDLAYLIRRIRVILRELGQAPDFQAFHS